MGYAKPQLLDQTRSVTQRCHHHVTREAVARCLECRSFFCRECIVEHEDRVICAPCLKRIAKKSAVQRTRFVGLARTVQLLCAFVAVWFFFYCCGRLLLSVPASFHEGSLWEKAATED